MRTFQPNCTQPPGHTSYVKGPNVRSTLDIVWSCLTLLLLCTWSIQHLAVPLQVKPRNWKESLRRHMYLLRRKALAMIVTLLAPEVIFGLALSDLVSASAYTRELKQFAETDGVEWTMTHSFFANMGGFIVRFSDTESPDDYETSTTVEQSGARALVSYDFQRLNETPHENDDQTPKNTRVNRSLRALDRFCERMENGFRSNGALDWKRYPPNVSLVKEALRRMPSSTTKDLTHIADVEDHYLIFSGNIWILNAPQLFEARKSGVVKSLPSFSEEDITDKSKGNALIKLIALVQITWLILQLVVRKCNSKLAAQLEIMTLAYCATSIGTYILLLRKPQDVQTPLYATSLREQPVTVDEIIRIARKGPSRVDYWMSSFTLHEIISSPSIIKDTETQDWSFLLGMASAAILFGCLHLLAWDFTFPHNGERIAWNTAALLTAGLPLVQGTFFRLIDIRHNGPYLVLLISLLIYILARLFMLVEAFRTLAFLSPDVFSSTWASNIPHFG